VKILGLPLKLWPLKILKAIGDDLGTFLEMDESFIGDYFNMVAQILVEMELREELL
jgi:hypothetical protein